MSTQQLQAKLQAKTEEMVQEIDTKHLRPLRKQGYLDMAKCCDAPLGREAFQACLQRAQVPQQAAEQFVQNELQEFQERLQRTAMACQDEVRDRGVTNPDRATAQFERCISREFEKHIQRLPQMQKRIVTELGK